MTPPPHASSPTRAETRTPRLPFILIPLAALIAVMPLIHHGCSCGHDLDFHLLSWMEAARQFTQGNLHPHWAFTPAFNAGEPRFVFYPPISWTVGALLGLLLTHLPGVSQPAAWSATPIVFTWIALTASGLTMHRLACAFATPNAALVAAILYLANPYMLFTAYERTAYAELLAAAWIPLLLLAIFRPRVTVPGIALPIALLWLTNAPAAVMGSYTLALLATLRILHELHRTHKPGTRPGAPHLASKMWASHRSPAVRLALTTLSGTFLGLALAAFYILPAAYERRFVQISMATIGGMRINQNFLFEHTGTSPDNLLHDQVLHTASTLAVILLIATAAALATNAFANRRNPVAQRNPVTQRNSVILSTAKNPHISPSPLSLPIPILSLAILTAVVAFLLIPLSLPLWNHAPQASFLQFPWRLLAILAPIAALTIAAALGRLALKPLPTAIAAVILAIALSHPAYAVFHQPCDPEDTPPARLALFRSNAGTDPTDEYTPTSADNDALTPNDPPYWLSPAPTAQPPLAGQPGAAPTHLTLNAPRAEDLILNLRAYPAWRLTLTRPDARPTPLTAYLPRPDGLIAIPIPAGSSTLDIRYTQTPDQTAGDALTLLAALTLVFLLRQPSRGAVTG